MEYVVEFILLLYGENTTEKALLCIMNYNTNQQNYYTFNDIVLWEYNV